MKLVSAEKIDSPRLKVSPPLWIMTFFWSVSIGVLGLIILLPISNILIKYVVLGIYSLVMFGLIRNQLKGNFLVTLQVNSSGLYFQTDHANQYFYIPWENIGRIEKAIFPLNKRGLRFEIVGKLSEIMNRSDVLGNVMAENGRTYIYTIPQLHNRDRLIKYIESLRHSI